MERGSTSSASGDGGSGSKDMYLRNLNKISHKISKPGRKPPLCDNLSRQIMNLPPPPPPPPENLQVQPQPAQNQPPVYNINKSDFRDIVQRLTGSPAHERVSAPPPAAQTKPSSSRLQRIRPPPLAQIGPPVMNFVAGQRPVLPQPFSPLPPLPSVHTAAESPISAYMRFIRNSFPSAPPPPPPGPAVTPPLSPLPFGCLPSPRSPYALPSPSQLGLPQHPLSPTVPSPTWKGI